MSFVVAEKGSEIEMTDVIYYDTFENSYVLERDENAPPERYVRTCRGIDGMYIESWVVYSDICDEDDLRLKIAFSEEDYNDKDQHDITVKHMMDMNHCKPTKLRYVTIPAHRFDEIVKQLEEERDMREPTFTNEIAACETTETAKTCGYKCVPMWVKNQRPSDYFIDRFVGKCPSCGELLTFDPKKFPTWKNYCAYCGQGIWWENPDNKRVEIDENKPESM